MPLDHVLLPCKMTSRRIARKNLARIGGMTLLQIAIDRFRRWFPSAVVWVATEDTEAASIAEAAGCKLYPLADDDLQDRRNVSELFNAFLAERLPSERCAWSQLTSPFMFRSELDAVIRDPRPFVRSAWIGRMHVTHETDDWQPLSQSLPRRVLLTGNFGVACGRHVVTPAEEAANVSPVSWLSAIDINTEDDLTLANQIARYMPLEAFDDVAG